jgi:hypothetical protein
MSCTVCSLFKSPLSYEKTDFRLRLNKSPPRVDTLHIMRFQCGFLYHLLQQHPENSFRARRKIYTTSIILSSLSSRYYVTKYARYIGISNMFICLRPGVSCHFFAASPCCPPSSMHSARFSGFPGRLAGPPSAIKSIAFNKSQTQIRTIF